MTKKALTPILALIGLLLQACTAEESNVQTSTTAEESKPKFITFMEDGGWCWYQDPRAVINNGKLVIAGLSGQNGDVKVSIYDLKENKDLGTVILHEELERDDHDVPALYVRPDGSILATYAKHATDRLHRFRISDTEDYLKWSPEYTHNHIYDTGWGTTYMNLYYLEEEELLYNFFRDGHTINPAFITSSDHGETWGETTHLIADEVDGFHRPYARYYQREASSVGISFTEAHPRKYGNSLYYADYRNGAFYNVDGSKIKDLTEGPLVPSEAQKIFTGSETIEKPEGFESVPNSAWTCSMASDSEGHPHIGYTLYVSNDDHRYRLASWNGKEWIDREIAMGGKCLYTKESSYTGLLALDPSNPSNIYISTDVDPTTGEDLGGTHEIYQGHVSENDSTSTIEWKAVTKNSDQRNIRPIIVSGEGYKVVIWLNGPWHTYTDYNSNVLGKILETP